MSAKSGFKSGEGTQVKVVALMRWEWQAGDQEKYWQGWQEDEKPGADHDTHTHTHTHTHRGPTGQSHI